MSFILGKRIRDDNSNFHWKNLSELDFKINKPSVLVLGGSGTQGDKDANGYAKLAENILGSFSDDVDILSVNYNHSTNEDEEIEKLVYDLFLPLVSKNNFKINVAQACKNVRKLTILAHCYGYYKITAGIEKKLDFLLRSLGFSETEKNEIMKQIFMVSVSSYPSKQEKFSSVFIASPFDEKLKSDGTFAWQKLLDSDFEKSKFITKNDKEELKNVGSDAIFSLYRIRRFGKNNQRCFVVRDKNRILLATSQLSKNLDESKQNEHNIVLFFNEDYTFLDSLSEAGKISQKCLASSLCYSVANSILNQGSKNFIPLDLDEIEENLNGITYAFNTQKTLTEKEKF